jgi:hypothetical protein
MVNLAAPVLDIRGVVMVTTVSTTVLPAVEEPLEVLTAACVALAPACAFDAALSGIHGEDEPVSNLYAYWHPGLEHANTNSLDLLEVMLGRIRSCEALPEDAVVALPIAELLGHIV